MSPPEKPLIVVLGLGEMGLVHAENLSKHRSIRLGLASTRADVRESAASNLHPDKLYTSYAAALSDPEVCAVVIATTVTSHPEMIGLCADAGKHIFCEKPLGNSVPSIRRCLERVTPRVRFMTGFQRRWDASFAAARRRVEDGALGKPVVLKCTSGDPEYPEKYHRFAEKNSMLLDLAVHDIDQARWLTRSEVARVYTVVDALTYPTLKTKGDADVGIAVLEMQNGAKALLHLSRALSYGYNVTAEFVGTKGTLQIGDIRKDDVVQLSDCGKRNVIQWDFRERFKHAFENEMTAFVHLVSAEEEDVGKVLADPRYAGTEDGLRSSIVAEALVRSAESGMPQDVVYE